MLRAFGQWWNRQLKPGQEAIRAGEKAPPTEEPPVKPPTPPRASTAPPAAGPSGPVTVPREERGTVGKDLQLGDPASSITFWAEKDKPTKYDLEGLERDIDLGDIEAKLETARDVTRAEDIGSMPEPPGPFDEMREASRGRSEDLRRALSEAFQAPDRKDYGSWWQREGSSLTGMSPGTTGSRIAGQLALFGSGLGGTGKGSMVDRMYRQEEQLEREKQRDLSRTQQMVNVLSNQANLEDQRQHQLDVLEANRAWEQGQRVPVTVGGQDLRVSPEAYMDYTLGSRQAEAQAEYMEAQTAYMTAKTADEKEAARYRMLDAAARLGGVGANLAQYGMVDPSMGADASRYLGVSQALMGQAMGQPSLSGMGAAQEGFAADQNFQEDTQRALGMLRQLPPGEQKEQIQRLIQTLEQRNPQHPDLVALRKLAASM